MPASITLTVAHLPSATSFFLACLQPLNYVYRGRVENTIGFGLPDAAPDFWITQSIPGVPPGPAHVAFPAVSREVVRQFFLAAMKTGAKCQGEPALRDVKSGYYSAAVIDFDNNSIEAVYREDIIGAKDNTSSDTRSMVSTGRNSKAPTTVSKSKGGTVTKSPGSTIVSKAPIKVSSTSPRTTVSKANSHTPPPPNVSGDGVVGFLDEAKGTLNVARELVSSVTGSKHKTPSETDSHGPSDAIVGTLLGVAAGAALHYAFSNRKKHDESSSPRDGPHPGITRSETAPSYAQERYRYYHGHEAPRNRMAIDNGQSSYSRASGQRMIEMIDNDPARSEYTSSTVRQQRRNSFTGPLPSQVSSIRSKKQSPPAAAPPTSYRAPTQISQKPSRSRSSSLSRETSRTVRPSSSPKQDEGYASASDTRSRTSRRSSIKHRKTPSERDTSASGRRRRGSDASAQPSSVITAIRNHTEPISPRHHHAQSPDLDQRSFHSARTSRPTTTKHTSHPTLANTTQTLSSSPPPPPAAKTGDVVLGKLTRKQLEKLEGNNGRPRNDITRSVIGKVKDMDRLGLSSREVRPEDSVSQVSSNNSSARRRR